MLSVGISLSSISVGLGGVPIPPVGFVFLIDSDGVYLTDQDGMYLVEAV